MAEIFENRIPYFFQILNTPAGSLPKGAQWVVVFEDLASNILPGIKLALQYEGHEWKINKAAQVVTSDNYQKTSGCVFCQAIGLPGESMTANLEGNIVSNAFLRSHVGQGRNQQQSMRMTFLDTNVSFAENFLRPWSISTANFGLIARSGTENYRTNAHCYKLGSFSSSKPPVVTMKVSFYGLCCIGVSEEEYNYNTASSPVNREGTFIYNHYAVNTETGNMFLNSSSSTKDLPNPLGLQNYGQQPVGQSLQAGNPFDKKVSMIPSQLSQEAANQRIQQAGSILSGPQALTP